MANVLLDTEVFRSHQFDFGRADYKTLGELVAKGKVSVFITRVIDGEVQRQIGEESLRAQQALRNTLKEHQVLRHSAKVPFDALIAKGGIADLTNTRLQQWNEWKTTCKVEEISVKDIDVDSIIDRYFQVKPPFGTGTKKAEFPDALTLTAARKWTVDTGQDLFVVSRDGDVKAFCEDAPHLHHLQSLAEFLERFTVEYISTAIAETLGFFTGEFIEYVGNEFPQLYFILDEVEGEVEAVAVDDVSVDQVHVIEAQDGMGVAEITTSVIFTAHVEYEDPDSGVWDSEEKRMLFSGYITQDITDHGTAVLTVRFTYDEDTPSAVEIEQVEIDKRTHYVSLPSLE